MKRHLFVTTILILSASYGQINISTGKNKITGKHSENITVINTTNSEKIIPENYSELKESPANGRKMQRIIADLDNDKIADTALIVQNKNNFADYLLLIYLTRQNTTYRLKLIDNFSPDINLFPVQLKIRNNVLEVGYFSDGTAAFGRFFKFRFDETKNKMRLIGYDSSYRITERHCNKSYNLINGTYIVKLQKSIPKNHTETFKGKKVINNIYIDDINIETLNIIDEIGNEFEPK